MPPRFSRGGFIMYSGHQNKTYNQGLAIPALKGQGTVARMITSATKTNQNVRLCFALSEIGFFAAPRPKVISTIATSIPNKCSTA